MKISDVAKGRASPFVPCITTMKSVCCRQAALTASGYRVYSDADLEALQQILFFRELDFSLEEIRKIMRNPAYKKEAALQKQKELLLQSAAGWMI